MNKIKIVYKIYELKKWNELNWVELNEANNKKYNLLRMQWEREREDLPRCDNEYESETTKKKQTRLNFMWI